jgi:hypothetical protein
MTNGWDSFISMNSKAQWFTGSTESINGFSAFGGGYLWFSQFPSTLTEGLINMLSMIPELKLKDYWCCSTGLGP